MRITSITIYRYTIDSICAEHIYDWRYHPSHKEIYTGSKCCEKLSSNNNKFCTYKGNRILYHSLCRNIGIISLDSVRAEEPHSHVIYSMMSHLIVNPVNYGHRSN